MTKADVQYLEYRAIADAKKAKNFVLNENKQTPNEPNLPEYQKDCLLYTSLLMIKMIRVMDIRIHYFVLCNFLS